MSTGQWVALTGIALFIAAIWKFSRWYENIMVSTKTRREFKQSLEEEREKIYKEEYLKRERGKIRQEVKAQLDAEQEVKAQLGAEEKER